MAWGYYPRQVTRKRSAPLAPDRAKGLGVLLVLAGILAAVLMFAIISEIMGPRDTEKDGDEASGSDSPPVPGAGPSLVGGQDTEWKGAGKGRTYGEYKGRPKKKEEDHLSTWERFKVEEEEKKRAESARKKELTEREREGIEGVD